MGFPLPDEDIVYGNDCPVCTPPVGSLWPVGETPVYIYVWFSGVQLCPGRPGHACIALPNNHWFKLTQHPIDFCQWTYHDAIWTINFKDQPNGLGIWELSAVTIFADISFFGERPICSPEGTVWHNQINDCLFNRCGHGGQAVVLWGGLERKIAGLMNIELSPNLMLEVFPLANDNIVFRYSREYFFQALYFLYSP